MQKFTLHCHTHALGYFDGKSTADEMIARAEEIGFEAIGISNHLIWHPKTPCSSPMFFNDWNKALDAQLRIKDEIQEAASKHKIKVFIGAEADFFPSAEWRKGFEKLIAKSEGNITDTVYEDSVTVYFTLKNEDIASFEAELTEAFSGSKTIKKLKEKYFSFKI